MRDRKQGRGQVLPRLRHAFRLAPCSTCECGFKNKPGIRYCANCGMSLAAADAAAEVPAASGTAAPASASPPPLSYPSYATVPPYSAPEPTDHSALFGEHTTPDLPDPAAAIALRQQEGYRSHGDTTATFAAPPAPGRSRVVVAIGAVALVVAGIAAWFYMGRSDPSPPQPGVTVAPVVTTPATAPVKAPTPIIIEEAPPAAAPGAVTNAASPAASATTPATPAAAVAGTAVPAPVAAPPPPLDPAVESADAAEAKRIAAEKRREKAARDRAERDAKAKVLAEQREQSAAAQRAEQESQARRRAEEAQRTRAAPPPPAPAPTAQARGVREICSGRGTIAEAVCQSRQCGLAEHANEAICRQLRDADERRRNTQN
jgi:hypothetical protein